MYESSSSTSNNNQSAAIRLGSSHGYRIDGDLASINAELSFVSERGAPAAQHWALQLWACDEPYGGGALSGFKVAEAPIALPAGADAAPSQLDAVTFAHLPASSRDYSMVLVLATGRPGAFDQVHDFANYPARERFIAPHFAGSVGYRLLPDGRVALGAQRVVNPRAANNLSGSLALQLWLLPEQYRGGCFSGTLLGSVALGRVHGQSELEPGDQEVALANATGAGAQVVLMLCEWTAEGYLTRDYCNFAEPYARAVEQPEVVAAAEAVEAVDAAVTEAVAVPVAVTEAAAVEAVDAAVTEAAAVAVTEAVPVSVAEVEAVTAPVTKAVAETLAEAAPAAVAVAEAAPVTATAALTVAKAPAAMAEAVRVEQPRLALNRASAEELARATGISRKMAAEVVKARPFKSFDELVKVRGIGEKTVRKFRDAMTL